MSFRTDPHDLLNTNHFIPLSDSGPAAASRYQDPDFYREYTRQQTHNMRPNARFRQYDTLTTDPINQLRNTMPDFPKRTIQNPDPILSDAVNDLVTPTYKKFKKTSVMIRSEFRDVTQYEYANDYRLDFDREFNNVYKIRLTKFYLPNDISPINATNNMLLWTYPSAELYTLPQVETFVYPFYTLSQIPPPILNNAGESYQQYMPENYATTELLKNIMISETNSRIYYTGEAFSGNNGSESLSSQGHLFSMDIDVERNRTMLVNRLENAKVYAAQTLPYDPRKYPNLAGTGQDVAATDVFYYYYDISNGGTVLNHQNNVPYQKLPPEYPVGARYNYVTVEPFPITIGIAPSFILTFEYSYSSVLKGIPLPGPISDYSSMGDLNIYPLVFTDLPDIGGFTADQLNYREFYDYNVVNSTFNSWAGSEGVNQYVSNFYRYFDSFTMGVKRYVRYAFYICSSMHYRNVFLLQQYDPNHWSIVQPSYFDTIVFDTGLANAINPDYIYSYSTGEVPVTSGVGFNVDDIVSRAKNFGPYRTSPLPVAGRATPLALVHKQVSGALSGKYMVTNSILPMLGWPFSNQNDEQNMWAVTVSFVHQNVTPILTKFGDTIFNGIGGVNGLTRPSTTVWQPSMGMPNVNIVAPFGRNVVQVEYQGGKYYMKSNNVQYLRLFLGDYQPDIISSIMIANNTSTVEQRTQDATNTSTQTDVNFQNLFCEIPTAPIPYNSNLYEPEAVEKIFDEGGLNRVSSVRVQLVDQSGTLTIPTKNHYFVLEIYEELTILRDTQITTRNNQVWTNSTARI